MLDEAAPAPVPETPATAPVEQPAAPSSILYGSETAPETPAPIEGEAKPEAAAEETKAQEPEKPADEPVKYDLKLPEGLQVDDAKMTEFTDLAAAAKVAPEAAQQFLDLHIRELQEAAQAPIKAWNTLQETWKSEVMSDPEIGGAHFARMQARAAQLLDRYGTPQLREALAFTGAGNHPDVIRFVDRIAKALTEGGPITGAPAPATPTPAAVLYPTHSKG